MYHVIGIQQPGPSSHMHPPLPPKNLNAGPLEYKQALAAFRDPLASRSLSPVLPSSIPALEADVFFARCCS